MISLWNNKKHVLKIAKLYIIECDSVLCQGMKNYKNAKKLIENIFSKSFHPLKLFLNNSKKNFINLHSNTFVYPFILIELNLITIFSYIIDFFRVTKTFFNWTEKCRNWTFLLIENELGKLWFNSPVLFHHRFRSLLREYCDVS